MKNAVGWIALLLTPLMQSSAAALSDATSECVVVSRTCTEPGGTRLVNGIAVTRDCWAWSEETACLTRDATVEAANGCATLRSDASEAGPGGCEPVESRCVEDVVDVDGNRRCVKTEETWRCQSKIDLPAVNAEWTGLGPVTSDVEDASACAAWKNDATCVEGERVCENGTCTRTYRCGGEATTGCSTLEALGCTVVEPPACDTATDPTCSVKTGRMQCLNVAVPEDVTASGDARLENETVVNTGNPTPNTAACTGAMGPKESCELIESVCTDASPTVRQINGRYYYSACWGYTHRYRCRDETVTSTCTSLETLVEEKRCTLEEETCVETIDGACAKAERVYRCQGDETSVPAGEATYVDGASEITELVHVSTCGEAANDASCVKTADVCVEGPATKIVAGVPVTKDCWKREVTYTCGTPGGTETIDGCAPLAQDASCRRIDSVCLGTNEAGDCTMRSETYACGGSTSETIVGEACDATLCIAGVCEAAPVERSETFAQGVAVMEIGRQAGVYGDVETDAIFSGSPSGCSVKAAGFSCCKPANAESAAMTSNAAFGVGLSVGLDAGWELVKYAGSPLVYDVLSASDATAPLLTKLYGTAGNGVYSPNFSFYGVSLGTNAGGSLTLNFSPAGFFAAAALNLATEYFSCTQDDQVHAMRRSQGLCRYVGSYCAKKGGTACLEKRESWCCFNSRLALTVQEQGRAQLGLGWGTPEAPICRGFTLDEFQRLDFSVMDLFGVVAEIVAKQTQGDLTAGPVVERANARVHEALQGLYTPVDTAMGRCATGVEAGCVSAESLTLRKSPRGNASTGEAASP